MQPGNMGEFIGHFAVRETACGCVSGELWYGDEFPPANLISMIPGGDGSYLDAGRIFRHQSANALQAEPGKWRMLHTYREVVK